MDVSGHSGALLAPDNLWSQEKAINISLDYSRLTDSIRGRRKIAGYLEIDGIAAILGRSPEAKPMSTDPIIIIASVLWFLSSF